MVNTEHEKPKPQAAAVGAEADFPAVWVVWVYILRKRLLWTFRSVSVSAADHWLLFSSDDFRRASVSPPHVRKVLKRTQTHNKSNAIMWEPAGNHFADYWTQLSNLYLSAGFANATTIRSDRSYEVAMIDPALRGASAVFLPGGFPQHVLISRCLSPAPGRCIKIGKQFSVPPIGARISKITSRDFKDAWLACLYCHIISLYLIPPTHMKDGE